jgi:ribonucleotide reductase beta subunit family protein with ferritin-like domain
MTLTSNGWAQTDSTENIVSQFSLDVQIAEARAFYSFQSMIEQVHSETYSLLIETYVRDQEEKDFLFKGMENSECCYVSSSRVYCNGEVARHQRGSW